MPSRLASAHRTVSRLIAATARSAERTVDTIERAKVLDAPSAALDSVVSKLPPGIVKDLLSGVPVGHSIHPALVAVPIGALTGAVYLDAVGEPAGARHLVGLGLIGSVPAALAGLSDWSDTRGAERRVGLAHALINSVGLSVVGASWLVRRGDPRSASAPWLTLVGFGIVGASSWLGGHLAYAMGVGVDTTAFQRPPTEWTDAIGDAGLVEARPVTVSIDGTAIMLVRYRGHVRALGDRCTHRGGPLHEGPFEDGCIECPWHASRFDVTDGSVVRGPATRPAPAYETRVVDGRVQVRRDEERTLRLNPVS